MTTQLRAEPSTDLATLRAALADIRAAMIEAEGAAPSLLGAISPEHQRSVRNLIHYLALRHHDIEPLQEMLRREGLSTLGRCEPAVLRTIDAVLDVLGRLTGAPVAPRPTDEPIDFDEAEALRRRRADALLGAPREGRDVSIMVTMPAAAAEHADVVRDLVVNGMDVMRINAASDDPAAWTRMVEHLDALEPELRARCRVMVDLPGPKLRTSMFEKTLSLGAGDRLELRRADDAGRGAVFSPDGGAIAPAAIGCQLPDALAHVEPGHRIWFDDGRIGAIVRDVTTHALELEITHTGAGARKLRGGKGINLPDTRIDIPALGAADDEALAFAAQHADVVGLSFVRTERDVEALQARLRDLDAEHLGVVLKIETRAGFEHLPSVMIAAMRCASVGVMIARGDLAVEVGYERLAEVQEEILWMCEAAHVPVVWATQVLEGLAKRGAVSRAEITDAAMAQRAECVMLNKGPYIVHAVRMLDDILGRMRRHQRKKRPVLRPLGVARRFFE